MPAKYLIKRLVEGTETRDSRTDRLRIDEGYGNFFWGPPDEATVMSLAEAATLVRLFETVPDADPDAYEDVTTYYIESVEG